jgi:hypothetical protein
VSPENLADQEARSEVLRWLEHEHQRHAARVAQLERHLAELNHRIATAQLTPAAPKGEPGTTACVATLGDGGTAAVFTSPVATTAKLCGVDADAGGPGMSVLFAGNAAWTADLDGGTFALTSSESGLTSTLCGCAVELDKSISATLRTSKGGALVLADGGYDDVTSFSGVLEDSLSASGSGSCACALPCGARWSVNAHR